MRFLFPRISSAEAMLAIRANQTLSLDQLRDLPFSLPASATFAATGGTPVPEVRLLAVRDAVRRVATTVGFPERPSEARLREFDLLCSLALHGEMEIVTGDAANDEVWMSIACLLLPEITPWRFPDPPDERYLKRVRNTLARLWWRVEILGSDASLWGDLGEDILVQIMERPTLSGDRRTARALCRASVATRGASGLTPPDLMRDAIQRVLRLAAVVALVSLDDAAIDDLVAECFAHSIEYLQRHPRPAEAVVT